MDDIAGRWKYYLQTSTKFESQIVFFDLSKRVKSKHGLCCIKTILLHTYSGRDNAETFKAQLFFLLFEMFMSYITRKIDKLNLFLKAS